jgi:hypothetical protein
MLCEGKPKVRRQLHRVKLSDDGSQPEADAVSRSLCWRSAGRSGGKRAFAAMVTNGSYAQGADPAKLQTMAAFHDTPGPLSVLQH